MPKIPFERIAEFYDTLMKGIEYRDWVDYTIDIFDRYSHKPLRVLDMACGTGTASIELARRGFEVTALDRSRQMLDILKKKRGSAKIEIVEADMQRFKLGHKVDAVTCYFDSVNYLMDEKEIERCFACVYEALSQKGMFVFDMNTIYGLERVWGTNTMIREIDNVYSVWKSVYDSMRNVSTLYLTLFIKNGSSYARVDEVHQERAYPTETIKNALMRSGFRNVEAFAHLTLHPSLDISSRVMYAAEKAR